LDEKADAVYAPEPMCVVWKIREGRFNQSFHIDDMYIEP